MTNSNDLRTGDKFNALGIEWIVTEEETIGVVARPTNDDIFQQIYEGIECLFVCQMVNKLPF